MVKFGFGPGGDASTLPILLAAMPGPIRLYAEKNRPDGFGKPLDLAVGHLLSHVKQEPTVAFFNATHQPAKLVQQTRLFPRTAPHNIVSALSLRKVGEFRRFFTVIEELIEWDFQSACHFL